MLVTVGYASHTASSFVAHLRSLGVDTLVDIRDSPRSRKPGFAKISLARRLAEDGIDYLHMRGLGAPKDLRDFLQATNDRETFLRQYRELLKGRDEALDLLAELARQRTVAAMCLETDPNLCHRHIVGELLRQRWPAIDVRIK